MAASTLRFDPAASFVDASSMLLDPLTAVEEAKAEAPHGRDGSGIPRLHGGPSPPADVAAVASAEDVATDFDETLSVCFHNVHVKTDTVDPASLIAEDSLLEEDEVWNALTSSYGCLRPGWKQALPCCLRTPAVSLKERPRKAAEELWDDEELREQLDMHSIVVPCLCEEPLLTADQVIEEIEGIMQDCSDWEAEQRLPRPAVSPGARRAPRGPGFDTEVRSLSIAKLNEHLQEAETDIRRFSEELVQQLALRDELDFEKEVKNTFISTLIDLQKCQKEQRELKKKKKKRNPGGGAGTPQASTEKSAASRFSIGALSSAIQSSFRQTFGSSCSERQYLTTVIPYEKKGHPPSLGDLQILTKILQAMRDDSDKVPALLTDYILQVLCPT